MIKLIKTVFTTIAAILMVTALVGMPLFYHDCSLHGEHNWQSGFFVDNYENHCICCKDTDENDITCQHHHDGGDCCNETENQDTETSVIAHSKCCSIKSISLKLFSVKELHQSIKHFIPPSLFFEFDVFQISTAFNAFFNSKVNYSPPDTCSGLQPFIFIFSQFLL